MKLKEIIKKLELKVLCCQDLLDEEVSGGYASDLLSNVIAHTKKGDVWVTMQSHVNIVAVGVLKELAAIIITQGREPDAETIKKATGEKVPLLLTQHSTFQVVGNLYEMGVSPID